MKFHFHVADEQTITVAQLHFTLNAAPVEIRTVSAAEIAQNITGQAALKLAMAAGKFQIRQRDVRLSAATDHQAFSRRQIEAFSGVRPVAKNQVGQTPFSLKLKNGS
jgi:hypothetical protein